MRKIREVILLHNETDLSNRAIARACRISNNTVGKYLARAEQTGLGWQLPGDLDEASLYRRLFSEKAEECQPKRPLPK